jgi:hypothetical protein
MWLLGALIADFISNMIVIRFRNERFQHFYFGDACTDLAIASSIRILVIACGVVLFTDFRHNLLERMGIADSFKESKRADGHSSTEVDSTTNSPLHTPLMMDEDLRTEKELANNSKGSETPKRSLASLQTTIDSHMIIVWCCCIGEYW